MLNEFKAFIAKGNVIDLAVAVIIAGAFGAIVSSLTDDILDLLAGDAIHSAGEMNLASLDGRVGCLLRRCEALHPISEGGVELRVKVNFSFLNTISISPPLGIFGIIWDINL